MVDHPAKTNKLSSYLKHFNQEGWKKQRRQVPPESCVVYTAKHLDYSVLQCFLEDSVVSLVIDLPKRLTAILNQYTPISIG